MSWQVESRAGIWLPQIEWWLDAHFPQKRSFVSHAHSDHVAPHGEILCSAGTSRLLRARVPGRRVEHVLAFEQGEQLTADCTVTLYPAGHIFGSAQALLNHEHHGSLLYTGDFKLRRGRSAEACATPQAQVLVMETTFGRPEYVFPSTAKVLNDIVGFCHECLDDGLTPVLFGYSLGKSQELLCGLAEAQLPVMLHPEPLRLTRVYEELGIRFPPYRAFDPTEAVGHVVICPPLQNNSAFLQRIGRRRTAVVTGWAVDPGAVYRYQCDAAFPLSDHADFGDLLRYVELVRPERVLTIHGFTQDFARTLRERGVEAWAIGEDNQLEFGLSASPRSELAGGSGARPVAASRDRSSPGSAAEESNGGAAGPSGPEHPSESILRPPVVEDGLADSGAATRSRSAEPAAPLATTVTNEPNSFVRFAEVADEVRSRPRKLEKIALLSGYLATLSPLDAAHGAVFFTGRPFPQSDGRVLTIGWSIIKRAVLEIARMTEADYRAAYHRFADAGDAAEALLAGKTRGAGTTLADVATFFDQAAAVRGPTAKLDLLQDQLTRLSPGEAKFLVKIVTGDLRIGLKEGLVEEAVAAVSGQPIDAVREANMLSGDISAVTRAACEHRLGDIQLCVFHPLQFMLASPEPTAEAILTRLGAPVWLEEKYDGIRCQVHKKGERVELYSRDLKRITGQFPDVARAAATLVGDFIVDGELLAWREGRALPFAELQKRLGRKGDDFFLGAEIPVSVSCYDLLWHNGHPLLKEPLARRREELGGLISPQSEIRNPQFVLAPVQQVMTAAEIEAAFLAARRRGNEGLMAKDPNSSYTPGRRGLSWLKLKKAYATLDVVVVGVEYGHGKRRDVLSDYTFAVRDPEHDRWLSVGKAYSGLTDAEIGSLTQHFLANTIAVQGRYRAVVPDTVIEVAFDTIQPSTRHQSGFALRFPRITRIRTDKTPAEIDTLEACQKLAAAAGTTSAATKATSA